MDELELLENLKEIPQSYFIYKPDYIYRFVPVNLYTLDCLLSNGLYFGSPSLQNDPLDSHFKIDVDSLRKLWIPIGNRKKS